MEIASTESIKIKRISQGRMADMDDRLAIEEPMQIQVGYDSETGFIKKNMAITMRTPGHDTGLATGFLFTEGIIKNRSEIKSVQQRDENTVLVTLHQKKQPYSNLVSRQHYTTSSCGICGKTSIDAVATTASFKHKRDDILIPVDLLYGLPAQLRKQQEVFESTGAIHGAALFDLCGNFIRLREDIGRHNALDKLIGYSLMNENIPMDNCILLLSGRAGFELIQKAAVAGIKIVAAIGAPSSLAVELARDNDITLVGFLKAERFNIYSGDKRLKCD
jgi:FdhD protein